MADNQLPITLQARCGNGRGPCRINFQFPAGTTDTDVPYACHNADCAHEHIGQFTSRSGPVANVYWGVCRLKDSGPYLVRCVAHREMMYFKKLRTARSDAPCSEDCTRAEGEHCRCSCGGKYHGMDA